MYNLVLSAILLAIVIVHTGKALYYPPFDWDALMYHLPFAAKWIRTGNLLPVLTPFGGDPTTYFPANASLFFMFLMSPLNDDVLVDFGQFPAFIIILMMIYFLCARLGVSGNLALFCALMTGLNPSVNRELSSSLVDLIFAAHFLLVIFFLDRFGETNRRGLLIIAGLNAGYFIGTKPIGILFSVPLACFTIYVLIKVSLSHPVSVKRLIQYAVMFLVCVFLTGSFFYLRNLFITGNPVYPLQVTAGGFELFPGSYTKDLMNALVLHSSGWHEFYKLMSVVFGKLFFPVLVLGVILACIVHIRQKPGFRTLMIFLTPPLLIFLHWFIIPFNNVTRFLIVATTLAYIPLVWLLNQYSRIRPVVLPIVALLVIHRFFEFSSAVFNLQWYILAIGAVLCGVLFFTLKPIFRNRSSIRFHVNTYGLLACHACLVFVFCGAWAGYNNHKYDDYVESRFKEDYQGADQVWKWFHDNIPLSVNIAYTGNNLPFPLFGTRQVNNVTYIQINGHSDWLFHDFYHHYRKLSGGHVEVQTPKPLFYRQEMDPEKWLENLKKKDIDFVCVFRLHPFERYIPHDAAGFPVEDTWARMTPQYFQPVFITSQAHVYRFGG